MQLEDKFYPMKGYEETHLINPITQKVYSKIKNKILKGSIHTGKKGGYKGINIKIIDYYMNDIETRKKWDASLKDFKKIEGDKSVYILHSVSHKPSFFIAEREVVDKRYDFYVNDIYYDFSSSVDDTVIPLL